MFPFHDNNPTVRPPIFTVAIIVINVLAFLWLNNLPQEGTTNRDGEPRLSQDEVVVRYGFVPKRMEQLRHPDETVTVQLDRPFDDPRTGERYVIRREIALSARPGAIYRSAITCLFLHGSWLHLLGNMWFFWIFGNNIEDRLGHLPFLAFYFVGGLAATAAHWAYDPQSAVPTIGASGAISAVLGAYAVAYPFARVKTLVILVVFVTIIELPALLVLAFWFVGQLAEAAGHLQTGVGGESVGVAWWAHVGGFVTGVVLMPLLTSVIPPPLSPPPIATSPGRFDRNQYPVRRSRSFGLFR